jgi:hypothetical protein
MRGRLCTEVLIFLLVILPLILLLGNYIVQKKWLLATELVGVWLLTGWYFGLFYGLAWMLLTGKAGYRMLAIVALILTFKTLYPFNFWMIYECLPSWGIQLYVEGVRFSSQVFEQRIQSNALTIAALSSGMAVGRFWRYKQQLKIKHMQQEVQDLRNLSLHQKTLQIYPHFVESVLAKTMGRTLFRFKDTDQEPLFKLLNLLRYAHQCSLHALTPIPVVKEWEMVTQLLDIIRWKTAQQLSIHCVENGVPKEEETTLPMSMVTLVENILKHGDLSAQGKIRIEMHWRVEGGYTFYCQNHPAPTPHLHNLRHRAGSANGFGLSNLTERIQKAPIPMQLHIDPNPKLFTVTLTQFALP